MADQPVTPPAQVPPNPAVTPPVTPEPAKVPPVSEVPAAPKAPEKYELKLADKSPLDAKHIEEIAAYARTQGFSNEQAQALLADREKVATGILANQQTFVADEVKRWNVETKSDKELGGGNWTQTEANVKRAMDKFAPAGSEFRKLVDETGYGNHPEFVRFVNAIGKAMAEDKPLNAPANGGNEKVVKTPAQVLFGGTAPVPN